MGLVSKETESFRIYEIYIHFHERTSERQGTEGEGRGGATILQAKVSFSYTFSFNIYEDLDKNIIRDIIQ